MICVPKPDGAHHVCISFFMVKQDIVKDAYPMHQVEKLLEAMAVLKVVTTLDLLKVYRDLLLYPNLKYINKFSKPEGLYQIKVLPLG